MNINNKNLELESAIYRGFVRHRRFTPRAHEFDYRLFMFLLKIDEIPLIFNSFWQLGFNRLSWARFRREDYVGPAESSLDDAVRQKIAELLGKPGESLPGDVFLLGHLRYFGFYFSPLNLYFLRQEGNFRYMLAEVSNTPWNERHYYLLDLDNLHPHDKEFHVSPFNPMDQRYQWRVSPPTADSDRCIVHLQSFPRQHPQERVFDATLNLSRVPLNRTELTRVLRRTPIQTASVVVGIYWQALRLLLKRTPLFRHPGKNGIKTGKGTV